MVNTDELTRLGLEAPQDWADLLKPEYQGLVWLAVQLVINTTIQKYGHDEVSSTWSTWIRTSRFIPRFIPAIIGFCMIGIVDNGYTNISGTSLEIGATAIFAGRALPIPTPPLDRVRAVPRVR